MAITLRQLTYLSALSEHRHFGHAADSVAVSQSALSQQIKELENSLGAKLVERGTKGITLTAIGRDVVARGERVLAEVRNIEHVSRFGSDVPVKLNLGFIPTVAPYLLPHVLPIIRARNIGLELGIREAQTHVLIEELRSGQLDAIVIALPSDIDGLHEVELFKDQFLLAGSKQPLEDITRTGLKPSQITPEQLLLLDDGHCLTDQALAACQIKSQARVDLRASSLTTLCRLASEGFGFTLLPQLAIKSETGAAPDLFFKEFEGLQPFRTIGLVRRSISENLDWFDTLEASIKEAWDKILKENKKKPALKRLA